MVSERECPICGTVAMSQPNYQANAIFYACPICGRFELALVGGEHLDYNKLASYLLYHRFDSVVASEYRYHTQRGKESCDSYNEDNFKKGIAAGRPVHMDSELINAWYPKAFSERVDNILLYIYHCTKHVGQEIVWPSAQVFSALFIDRYESIGHSVERGQETKRAHEECLHEAKYILEYLTECNYVKYGFIADDAGKLKLSLTPKGYSRVDELQKNSSFGRSALVAMKFGEDTKNLREAIRCGIESAEYQAIFIDEVQHNEFITPELLRYIRDSKFVVVDLTH